MPCHFKLNCAPRGSELSLGAKDGNVAVTFFTSDVAVLAATNEWGAIRNGFLV